MISNNNIKFQILHDLLESSANTRNVNLKNVVSMILKTLYKLTRSLRLRIYYYCEPCIANKKQKVNKCSLNYLFDCVVRVYIALCINKKYIFQLLVEKLSNYYSSETRDSPDGGFPEVNYQAYQSTVSI